MLLTSDHLKNKTKTNSKTITTLDKRPSAQHTSRKFISVKYILLYTRLHVGKQILTTKGAFPPSPTMGTLKEQNGENGKQTMQNTTQGNRHRPFEKHAGNNHNPYLLVEGE